MVDIGFVGKRLRLASLPLALVLCLTGAVGGCRSEKKDALVFEAGEKAQVDRITCSVVDAQIFTRLGEGSDARMPRDRFYLTQISLFNGGNSEYTVPTLALVDDQGSTYPELADGRAVPSWMGISRKLSPGETLQGNVVFDAPIKHYKLRITDEFADVPVLVDLPAGFVHEKTDEIPRVPETSSASSTFPIPTAPGASKK